VANKTIKTLSGTDLMVGVDLNKPSEDIFSFQEKSNKHSEDYIPPNPFIIAAFISSILGLLLY